MPPLAVWLTRVLARGESEQEAPPTLTPEERAGVLAVLRTAFDGHALDVAGPPVAFEPVIALDAATLLARACWLLVGADEKEPTELAVRAEPASPSAHLSADVTLRFLPAVFRRAKVRSDTEPLAAAVETLLRAWPLSGVLADLDGEPTTPPEFGGHPGLQLLYAERLVTTGRPGWVPAGGAAREWVERVYSERDKPLPAPPKEEARA
jgi:hypothetical protein